MSDQSPTFAPTTCVDTHSVISSPESVDGLTPCSLPDGPTTPPCGPDRARASHSASQANWREQATPDIFGLNGSVSSASAALQSRLESKLRAKLPTNGSTMYSMTWKALATPAERRVFQLAASMPHTCARGSIGLPTPQSIDAKGTSEALRHKFRVTGHLKHWTHGTQLAVHSSTGISSWPNPMFAEWLMGYPHLWIYGHDYTPTETQ